MAFEWKKGEAVRPVLTLLQSLVEVGQGVAEHLAVFPGQGAP